MKKIQELALAMINYDNGDPKRIQHTTKVHAYASLIGIGEGLDEDTQFILESAALVHDIGIRAIERNHHDCGELMEQREQSEACSDYAEHEQARPKVKYGRME